MRRMFGGSFGGNLAEELWSTIYCIADIVIRGLVWSMWVRGPDISCYPAFVWVFGYIFQGCGISSAIKEETTTSSSRHNTNGQHTYRHFLTGT